MTDAEPCCVGCKGPLDSKSKDLVSRYPVDFRDGCLGACCAEKGGEDSGWGDAQEHGYDF